MRLTSGKQGGEDDEVEDHDAEYKRQEEEEAEELRRLRGRGRGRARGRGRGGGGRGKGRGRRTQEGNQEEGANEVAPTAAPAPNSAPTPTAPPAPPAAKEDKKDEVEILAEEAEAKVHQDMQERALERHQGGGEEDKAETPRKPRKPKANAKATPKRKAKRATPKKRARRGKAKTPEKVKGDDEGSDNDGEEPGDALTPRRKKRKVSQDWSRSN